MYADHHVECRANVAIRKGEEITDHYVSPLFGTMYRRSHLRDGWYFDCKCRRCQGRILLVQTLNKKVKFVISRSVAKGCNSSFQIPGNLARNSMHFAAIPAPAAAAPRGGRR